MDFISFFKDISLSREGQTSLLFFFCASILLYFVSRWFLARLIKPLFQKTKTKLDDLFFETKVVHRISLLIPTVLFLFGLQLSLQGDSNIKLFIERVTVSALILILALILSAMINALVSMSQAHPSTKDKPLKSIAQAIKVLIYATCLILILSTMLNRSPWVFLSGIGAMTAVVLLVFKDSILGLVAGIQLSALDMVRIGDWIEIPKYHVDGDVLDITLNTVKIQNFDKTVTTVPPYFLTTQAFKNYRGMKDAGMRRIKRSITLDQSSITFANLEMISNWKKISVLTSYLEEKEKEISNYNQKQENPANFRRITNIGTFRQYVLCYLQNHPHIDQNATLLVRQLKATAQGLPIELYTFVSNPEWITFENVQSDIFDHVLSIVPTFGLRIFQSPTGFDFSTLREPQA